MTIRRATANDAMLLSELSFRSKAYWGYDPQFMEACREDLTLRPEHMRSSVVYLLETDGGEIAGFYSLRPPGSDGSSDAEAELDSLFIAPEYIGLGYGKRLWSHMLATAAELRLPRIRIHSDPYAEAFYTKMGAVRIDEIESTVFPDRKLPLMELILTVP
ncbi:N-acetylglutamate synthase [Paenibacillus sp. A3]|uniref:GNAT family N-acetyltransferase n=1 Tax=Paenibacillus sp. A3 TaxID=1337054 RepID=UPI0006D5913C|nr:GNAT family N-acetyltransferase [Paenibacillus sp. A3]KPV57406.1 N-acetylglutamate synthase [Paenibacillus sp. A3]